MARLVARSKTGPPTGSTPKILEEGGATPSSFDRSETSPLASASPVRSSGRAGMVRTTSSTSSASSFMTSGNHSAALGRGHNQSTITQQNYNPFLDETFLVKREHATSSMNQTSSMVSIESRMSSRGGHGEGRLIYLDVEFLLFDMGKSASVAHKTLGFDSKISVHDVMNEMISYLDMDHVRPKALLCKNTGLKLEDGTLHSNNVEDEFLMELHLTKDETQESETNRENGTHFLSRISSNTVSVALLMFNPAKQVIINNAGLLPTLLLTADEAISDSFGNENKEFLWAKGKSLDWEVSGSEAVNNGAADIDAFTAVGLETNIATLESHIRQCAPSKLNSYSMKSLKFKLAFYKAVQTFQKVFGMNKLGVMYHRPINISAVTNGRLITIVQFASYTTDADIMKANGLKWRNASNMNPNFYKLTDDRLWALYVKYFQRRKFTLAPGVYVGVYRVRNTTDSIDVLTLEHDPSLVPIARVRATTSRTFTSDAGGDRSQTSSTSSMNAERTSHHSAQLMTDAEKTYILHLAEKDRNPVEMLPKGFVVTKELEAFATQVKTAMKVLASQVGMKDFEMEQIVPFSPVKFGADVQVLMVAPREDMQTATAAPKQSSGLMGMLGKLALGSKDEAKGRTDFYDDKHQLTYLPIALFELLHQHDYNEGAYSSYRRSIEHLNASQLLCDVTDDKGLEAAGVSTTSLQKVLGSLNEKKKEWNGTQSWTLKIIQHYRAQLLEQQQNMRK